MSALSWGAVLLLVITLVLAVVSLVLDYQRSAERERVRALEAESKLREAKYLTVLREKVLVERDLEATRGELDATRTMLADTTRALFRSGVRHG